MAEQFGVTVQEEKDYAILATQGYIDQRGGEKIAEEIDKLMAKDFKFFVVNLEKSKIINSTALSIITGVVVKTRNINGSITFSNLTRLIQQTFKIMGLTDYATLCETQEEAIAQLKIAANPS